MNDQAVPESQTGDRPGDGATGHDDRRVVGLVIRREVTERLRTKSFRVATLLIGVVALAAVIIPHVINSDDRTRYDVGLVDAPAGTAQGLTQGGTLVGADVRPRPLPDDAAADAALRSGAIDAAVVGTGTGSGSGSASVVVVVRKSLPSELEAVVNRAVSGARSADTLAARGVPPQEAAGLLNPSPLTVRKLEPGAEVSGADRALAFAGSLFLYLSLLSFGMAVATGVVEEKSTRVSEILLGAMRPSQLLAGKVVGIGVVGALQVLAVGLPAGVTALVLGSFEAPAGTAFTFAAIGMWFVLGFGFYSCAYAAAGASVSRSEEVANVTLPLTMLLLVGYLVGVFASSDPGSTLAAVTSFIPPLSPMVMVSRVAVSRLPWWEVPLAVVIELASTWVLIRFAGRVYTGAIVRTGPRVKFRDAWRTAEH